ncbi:hypothetical protein EXW39_07580 [Bacillus mycoides]|nr:hypothetical protein EXW39_07580 [Bacillus mycoides]
MSHLQKQNNRGDLSPLLSFPRKGHIDFMILTARYLRAVRIIPQNSAGAKNLGRSRANNQRGMPPLIKISPYLCKFIFSPYSLTI